MTEQNDNQAPPNEEAATETMPAATEQKTPMDPVRKWTFIILALCVVLMAWYLVSDRLTPFTSQARVHALVVPIAPEVSGTITSVSATNNMRVTKGQELFQIDTDRFELEVATAQANLKSARQATGVAIANIAAAEASLVSRRASLLRAKQDAVRLQRIREEDPGAISERRLESAEATLTSSEGQVAASEANLEKAKQNLGETGDGNANVLQAQASLDQAELNLARATIRAPENGVVTGTPLDRGNFAAAGAPQMTFIAFHNIWVQADFSENNLGNIKSGDPVEIIFDMMPGEVFEGSVSDMGFGVQVDSAPLGSLPTIENDRNWLRESQRFPVRVEFSRDQDLQVLRVGSQASVIVFTGESWLFNNLGSLYVRIATYLSYAY
jgi:multidrug resistance efflux pump